MAELHLRSQRICAPRKHVILLGRYTLGDGMKTLRRLMRFQYQEGFPQAEYP
jgi:hypothetical protein